MGNDAFAGLERCVQLRVGQTLVIPAGATAPAPTATAVPTPTPAA